MFYLTQGTTTSTAKWVESTVTGQANSIEATGMTTPMMKEAKDESENSVIDLTFINDDDSSIVSDKSDNSVLHV